MWLTAAGKAGLGKLQKKPVAGGIPAQVWDKTLCPMFLGGCALPYHRAMGIVGPVGPEGTWKKQLPYIANHGRQAGIRAYAVCHDRLYFGHNAM